MHFSKAGLNVPEELSLLKKDGDQKASENSEAAEEDYLDKIVDSAKNEDPQRKCNNHINNVAMKPVECKLVIDVGLSDQEPKTEGSDGVPNISANQAIQSCVPSCSGEEILQVISLQLYCVFFHLFINFYMFFFVKNVGFTCCFSGIAVRSCLVHFRVIVILFLLG